MHLLAHPHSLPWMIFIRIAPAATGLLLIVVAVNNRHVSKSLRREVQGRVNASAIHAAQQADTRLTAMASACAAVAANDIVANGIVDIDHRQSTLSSYFRSLRLPGPASQQVLMTDYKGRLIAPASRTTKTYGDASWYPKVMAGHQFIGAIDSALIVATPVLHAGRAEGIVVATFDLHDLFKKQIVVAETNAVVFHQDRSVIFSTKPQVTNASEGFRVPTDWLHATSNLDALPELSVSYLEPENYALSAANAMNTSQMIQLLVLLSGLMTAILLAARLASWPLENMLKQVSKVKTTGDLSLRVDRDGPTEFISLADGFNAMLSKLQRTTVSQQRYQMSEGRLKAAVQGAKDGLWDWDFNTDHVWYSPRYKEMLGYNDHEFPNAISSFKDHLHPQDTEKIWKAVGLHVHDSAEYDVEHRLRKKSGEYGWFRARGAVVRDQSGTPLRMSGSMQDISELKKYQQTLERSNRDLEQFAFIASHDLQEPLRKVASFCGLLRDDYGDKLDDEGKMYIEYAVDGATRMRSLVLDLLAFSKIGSDKNQNSPIDTQAMLDVAILNLEAAIEESRALISHDILPPLLARDVEISQLFQNLISNAIKYRSDRAPLIHVGVVSESNHWKFSVSDNGIGISPEYQEQVFGIFKRLHSRDKFSGTGIGLAICKRIVEKLDGEIWFDAKHELGCKICFTVPKHTTQFPTISTTGAVHEHVPITT